MNYSWIITYTIAKAIIESKFKNISIKFDKSINKHIFLFLTPEQVRENQLTSRNMINDLEFYKNQ